MLKTKSCACKGIRTCLLCEDEIGFEKSDISLFNNKECLEYCYICRKAWPEINANINHPDHKGEPFNFPGILIALDFITSEEEEILVNGCDTLPWNLSQSGRKKQNFGPKINFKKKKISGTNFTGFPKFGEFVHKKLQTIDLLSDFVTIEQCAIEYTPETGACIDPHIDDCWIWGERVISLSLISDTYLIMTKYKGSREKYNLKHINNLNKKSEIENNTNSNDEEENKINFPVIRIPMPKRSLLVMYGKARYEWEHAILRSDIKDRRICMAYREFPLEYLEGKLYENFGKEFIKKSQIFWDI